MKIKQPVPWLVGLAAFGLIGGAVAYFTLWRSPPKIDITALTVPVTTSNLKLQITANGVTQPIRKINLSPKDAGRIAKLYVDEGNIVQKGQLIAEMERQQFQAQVNQYRAVLAKAKADLAQRQSGARPEEIAEAQARVASAEANVREVQAKLIRTQDERRRNQMLADAGAIARNTLEEKIAQERETQANLEAQIARLQEQKEALRRLLNGTRKEEIAQAQAEVAQATSQLQFYETQLENTYLRAPFSGMITRRFAQEGDYVTPNTSASSSEGATSTSIAELSSGLEVEAKVPESNMANLINGQAVEIRVDAYPNQVFKGHVRLISPRAIKEENVTSLRVKVALDTGQDKLKPGVNARLTFIVNEVQNSLVVPTAAVVPAKEGQVGVLIPDKDNKAKFHPVKVGITSGDQTQILEGLSQGERVFLEPPVNQVIDGVDNTNGL